MLPLCGTLRGETLTFRVQEKQMWSWVRGGVPLSLVEPLKKFSSTRIAMVAKWPKGPTDCLWVPLAIFPSCE